MPSPKFWHYIRGMPSPKFWHYIEENSDSIFEECPHQNSDSVFEENSDSIFEECPHQNSDSIFEECPLVFFFFFDIECPLVLGLGEISQQSASALVGPTASLTFSTVFIFLDAHKLDRRHV